MTISTSELRENLNKYITLSKTEDIFITKHGEVVAKLVNPNYDRIKKAESLFGILPKDTDISLDQIRKERIAHTSDMEDFEDALIVSVAKRNNINCLVTRNKKDFQKTSLEILSPDEFMLQFTDTQ